MSRIPSPFFNEKWTAPVESGNATTLGGSSRNRSHSSGRYIASIYADEELLR